MNEYIELMESTEDETTIEAEMREMPPTADPLCWCLEHYQLQECAHCGTREGKLDKCSGCRSFVYCCREQQTAHWKSEHKHVCLKRKSW